MFTSVDKALVALVMSLASLATMVLHISMPGWLNEAMILQIVALVTPVFVYLVPNKKT